jgi:hypothetical protein
VLARGLVRARREARMGPRLETSAGAGRSAGRPGSEWGGRRPGGDLLRGRLRARERAALEVAYGLFDFFAGIHDEGAVLHYGFAQREARQN